VFCGVLDGLTSHRGTQSAISNEQIIRRFTTIRDDLIRVRWPTTTQVQPDSPTQQPIQLKQPIVGTLQTSQWYTLRKTL